MTITIISILIGAIWLLCAKKEKAGCGCISIIIIGIITQLGINCLFDSLKHPTDKFDLRLSNRVESFAKKELPSFIKNRDDIANTMLKIGKKRDKHLEDAKSMRSGEGKKRLKNEAEKLKFNISVIRKKAEDINASIEELYAIKETEDKYTFDIKISNILKKSEDLKAEASAIASDMEKTF